MKNKLLAAVALCCATSSTMPLWAAEWEDPQLSFVTPNLNTDGTGGGVYYIYHVSTQKFMNNGNFNHTWNTEVVVADEGQPVTLVYGNDYQLARTVEGYADVKGWRLSMKDAPSSSGFHELYANPGTDFGLYVDHNMQGHMLWNIVAQGDGTYRIRIIDEDPEFGKNTGNAEYANTCMGVQNGLTGVNPLIAIGTSGYEDAGLDWKFVEPAAYEAFIAKKSLKAALEEADSVGYTDLDSYTTLYNSTTATADEVTASISELKQKVVNWQSQSATPTTPVDLTTSIKNNSFSTDVSDGWTYDSSNTPGRQTGTSYQYPDEDPESLMDCFCEMWVASPDNLGSTMNISQTLTSMPTGKYRLTAYTIGYQQSDYQGITPYGVYLYANSDSIEYRAEAHTLEFGGIRGTEGVVDGAPSPRKVTLEFYSIGGDIQIGFKTVNTNCNWVGVDNFKLEYLGMDDSGMAGELSKVITEAEELEAEYTSANTYYSNAGKEEFDQLLATAKEAAANPNLSDKELGTMLLSLQDGMNTLRADASAYATLYEKYNALDNAYSATSYIEGIGLPEYEDFLDELIGSYNDKTFDPNEVDSIDTRASNIFVSAVKAALKDGRTNDASGVFTNTDFSNGATGWSGSPTVSYEVAEKFSDYGDPFDVYQEEEGLPQGSYEISLQGYFRPTGHGITDCAAAWGVEGYTTNDILAYLYGNDGSSKLPHLFDSALDEQPSTGGWLQITGTNDPTVEGKWVPNDMAAGAYAISDNPDRYLVKAACYVGEDGKLRIGVKAPTTTLERAWALFDNFKVTYLGADDLTGAASSLTALIDEAKTMSYKEDLTTAEAKDKLNNAILAATDVLNNNLTTETFKEQKANLNEAIEFGQSSLDLAAKFNTIVTDHDNKLNSAGDDSYEKYMDLKEFDVLADLVYTCLDLIDNDELKTVDEVNDYIDQVNVAYGNMVQASIDVSTVSKDSPVDVTAMIVNPSFQSGTGTAATSSSNGWSVEGVTTGAFADLVCEAFNVGTFDVYQQISGLKQGYYHLGLNGFYRMGDITPAAVAHRDDKEVLNSYLYADNSGKTWQDSLTSIFSEKREYKYDSGDVVLADSLHPEDGGTYMIIPNNMVGAQLAFSDGLYENGIYFYVEEGQPVRIGVRKDAEVTNDWTCFDGFTLAYYGDGDANKPDGFQDGSGVDETIADGKATVVRTQWFTLNGMVVDTPKQRGIYIRQDTMSDGTKKTLKVLVK
ncbi:MAG: hypothetical protein LUC45_06390 [Paraprevotella sp.]|nr:hypothetical protein [Paraprevotella sp.]